MAGRLEGRVAFITGAARGQGRSHALTLAREGADIIAVDICEDIRPVLENPTHEDARTLQVLPVPWLQPEDISNALLFLVSDDARYITGAALPVDAGALLK